MRPPLALGGDHERPVLDPCPLVHVVGDVLAGSPLAGLSAPGNGLRPVLVQAKREPTFDICEVRTRLTDRCGLVISRRPGDLRQTQYGERLVGLYHRIGFHPHLGHDAASLRLDDVLHLHGFEDDQRLACRHLLSHLRADLDDQGLHR